MKIMKKLAVVLLSVSLCIPCFSMIAEAAHGRISFTDPETAVGEVFEVKCHVNSTSGNMGTVKLELSYDDSALRFQSGDGVTDNGDGTLTCESDGGAAEAEFYLEFQALEEGETKVSIDSVSIVDANGIALEMDEGSSAIKIAEGDPSKITEETSDDEVSGEPSAQADTEVDMGGVSYTLTDKFADADIPSGYVRTQMQVNGNDQPMVTNSTETIYLAYMVDEEENGDFFLYDQENGSFYPYEEITISDTTSIIVLSETEGVELPGKYKEAKLTLNGKDFPVWQDTEVEGYYIIHALNNNGEEGYYSYDSVENTYQRAQLGAETESDVEETPEGVDAVISYAKDNFIVVLAGGILALIILLIILVLAIKLRHRNAELDELYDEYGIDAEEEPEPAKAKTKANKKERKKEKYDEEDFETTDLASTDFEEDFEEDFQTTDFESIDLEADFEENFETTDLASTDLEESFETTDFESFDLESRLETIDSGNENIYAGYDTRSEIMIDDLDALLGEQKPKKPGHMETDDTFQMDFIDLD